MSDDLQRFRATDLAFDALAALIVQARREGIKDAETACAAINAALGIYRHIHGPDVAPYAAKMLRDLAEAEVNRIMGLDARLIGNALGSA